MARKSKLNFEEHTLEAKDKQNCGRQASTPKNGGEVNFFFGIPADPNLQEEEEKLKST